MYAMSCTVKPRAVAWGRGRKGRQRQRKGERKDGVAKFHVRVPCGRWCRNGLRASAAAYIGPGSTSPSAGLALAPVRYSSQRNQDEHGQADVLAELQALRHRDDVGAT